MLISFCKECQILCYHEFATLSLLRKEKLEAVLDMEMSSNAVLGAG